MSRRAAFTHEGRPANQEMIDGYMDGRDINCPEASENRSLSYRHGFRVGRAEIQNKVIGSYKDVLRQAHAAMDEDAAR